MKKVFICNTYYHLFISIVYSLVNGDNNSVIICSDNKNNKLVRDDKLIKRLDKSNVFDKVVLFDHSDEEKRIRSLSFSSVRKVLFTKKAVKDYKHLFDDYDEVFIFYDNCLIGRIINELKIKYTLLEDGLDTFKNKNKNRIYGKKNIKKIIKHLLNYKELGKSSNIKKIIVNDKKDLCLKHNNIVEDNKEKLLQRLTFEDKKKIFKIFTNKNNFDFLDNCTLIITQPLFDDNLMSSPQNQIEMYQFIIDNYTNGEKIVIKTHPRETVDYKNQFPKAVIITELFPIEIITFLDTIKIKKIITVSSTSINAFKNADEIVYLGWDWFNDYKESKKYNS